jgi:septal ring factor EnvC (AmiA/AmiB activator)
MMARQVNLDKLKVAEASARQALASAHAKAEKLRRQVDAAEKESAKLWGDSGVLGGEYRRGSSQYRVTWA